MNPHANPCIPVLQVLTHKQRFNLVVLLVLLIFSSFIYVYNISDDSIRMIRTRSESLNDTKPCKPRTKVAYLKTHKTASSTIQNIFLRHAIKNDLNVVLGPPERESGGLWTIGGPDDHYRRSMLVNTPWEKAGMVYDVFCLHSMWNQAEVEATMGPGSAFVTILRDPISQFESLWAYSGLTGCFNMSFLEFAHSETKSKKRCSGTMGRDQQLWDLGLASNQLLDDPSAVQGCVQETELHFDLVMLVDRFEESLIFLKELMCWEYSDVLSIKLNVGEKDDKISKLSPKAKKSLEKYLESDYVLYNHFKKIFEKKLDAFGRQRMQEEIASLRMANYCAQDASNPGQTEREECRLMRMAEGPFVHSLILKQTKKANTILGIKEGEEENTDGTDSGK